MNNSGSPTLENESADRASGERVWSTDSNSSAARINGVVYTSDMVGNIGYMNQETSVELAGAVEESEKEGEC